MAKVIGFDPKLMKQCNCRKCAAIIEYSEHEVFSKKVNYDYLGDYNVANCVKCPNCGNDVQVR